MIRRLIVLALFSSVSSAAALAQSVPPEPRSDTSKEEIVVTATRQSTRLADAPVAATVLTEQFIRDARIDSLRQIDDYIPNVQFNQTGQVGGTYVTIRGIESNPFIVNRAAVYVDGIPFRKLREQTLGTVEQIEVLRGPQGTLYGANTESGLIVIRTRQPSEAFEGEVTGSGFGFGNGLGGDVRLAMGGPLIKDRLTASMVASYSHANSFVRNIGSSIGEEGQLSEAFVQGKLRWTPSAAVMLDLLAQTSILRAPGLYEQEFLPIDRNVYNRNYAQAFNGGRRAGRFTLINDAPKRTAEDEVLLAGNLNVDFGGAVLDFNASWRQLDVNSQGTDLDLTALPDAAGANRDDETFWNFEARLASPAGARVQWVAGLNHYRSSEGQILATLAGPGGLDDYVPAPLQATRSRDYAVFGQITVPLLANVRLTAGARYERAEREKVQEAGVLDLGPFGQFQFPAEDLSRTFEEFLPKVSLDWRPGDALLIYASAAKGWIPGGFNLGAASSAVTRDFSGFGAETLWSYEVGAKLELLDRRLLVSGAVFHIDANNWQEFNVLVNDQGQAISTNLITSDANVRSRGFELEVTGKPSTTLELAASLGYVDSTYTDYRFSATQDFTGNRVRLVPEYDASLSASWRPWKGLLLRGELAASGSTPLNPENTAFQDAVVLIGGQIGWEAEHWTARIYVENLTDERVFNTNAFANFAFGNDGTLYAGVAPPRVVGLQISYRW
ncbi:MAG: TonB-dependent receptor [Blastomonas sp.]|jgi:iron complex outermembrane receptor protein|nr:TonB-dependent receptor [Blastomonas sp.]|tara:strand:- start:90998 stop:93178 length:2181 start_codon:yes stop_codon:yes gene_type:complete